MNTEHVTAYFHVRPGYGDDEQHYFVFRADRYVSTFVTEFRKEFGDANVRKIEFNGHTAWAVLRSRTTLTNVIKFARRYFEYIVPERESVLGFAPVPDRQDWIDLASVSLHWPEETDGPSPVAEMRMSVESVMVLGSATRVKMEGFGDQLEYTTENDDEAAIFGGHIGKEMIVRVFLRGSED